MSDKKESLVKDSYGRVVARDVTVDDGDGYSTTRRSNAWIGILGDVQGGSVQISRTHNHPDGSSHKK